MSLENVLNGLARRDQDVIELQSKLVSLKAIGTQNGGRGEWLKAAFLLDFFRSSKLVDVADIAIYSATDSLADRGERPNIALRLPGQDNNRTLWVISHMDVTPPGDLALWHTDPFCLHVDGDLLFGRGVEDNHQGLVGSLLVALELLGQNTLPPISYGLMFVADEETGSRYGLIDVLDRHPEILGPNDLFLVPDFGTPDSKTVEVAEKGMLSLKITLTGKQCHAATPDEGLNSLVAAADFILQAQDLEQLFDKKNPIFSPPCSTFAPTKKEANVENINTIPGRDVFYVDCRVLPEYDLDEILRAFKEIGIKIQNKHKTTVNIEIVQNVPAARPTSPEHPLTLALIESIKDEYEVLAKPIGIGGRTVADILRARGFPAVVWGTWRPSAHQPNEYSSIRDTLKDAAVMARLLFRLS